MRRLIGVALVAALLVGGGSVLASPVAGGAGDRTTTIRLHARTVDAADLDLGARGPSLGDQLVFSDNLFQDADRVGTTHGSCTLTRLRVGALTLQCVVTLILDGKGQITVQGAAVFRESGPDDPRFTVAVTGGTGRYRDAAGVLRVQELSETEADLVVELTE
jgi:hypothetical protein